MERFFDKWIGIPLIDIKNGEYLEYIHPAYFSKIDKIPQYLLKCINIENDYLVLEIDVENVFRIKPIVCQIMQKPKYFIGNSVKLLNTKGHIEFGIIRDFYWHNNQAKYVFSIEMDGRIKSRRYYEEDMELV